MRTALSAAALPDADLPALLAAARAAGHDAVHLFRDRTEASLVHPDFSVRRIRQTLTDAGVELVSAEIRALTGRKADSDEHNLAYNRRQLEWDTHLCRALGVRRIAVRGGAATDEARADLVEGVGQLAERIGDVTFAVGPQAGTCLASAADIDAVLGQLPDSAGLLLDTGALLAAGDDPVACARSWGCRVQLVTLCEDDRLDTDSLHGALADAGYDGPLVLEERPAG